MAEHTKGEGESVPKPDKDFGLEPIKIADWDPKEPIPVLCGDPAGEVLIAEGDLVGLAGDVGAGKTITTVGLGLAQAFNLPFLGFKASGERKVMVLLADGDGMKPCRARAARLALGMDLEHGDVDSCGRFRLLTPDGFNLDDDERLAALRKRLDAFDPDLFSIETITSLMGKTRNAWNQSDVSDFISTRLRPLLNRPKGGGRRTITVGMHFNKENHKGNGRLIDRVGGSFYMTGGPDAVIGLEADGDRKFNVFKLKTTRWGCGFAPFHVTISGDYPDPLKLVNDGPVAERTKRGRRPTAFQVAIAFLRAYIAKHPSADNTETVAAAQKAGIGRTTAYDALKAIRAEQATP